MGAVKRPKHDSWMACRRFSPPTGAAVGACEPS